MTQITDPKGTKIDIKDVFLTDPVTNLPVGSSSNPLSITAGLSVPAHDYISLAYTGANLTGVVYKSGGSGGTTVATLTLAYDGSGNLTSVTRS